MRKHRHDNISCDEWTCVCSNTPGRDGFSECDPSGKQIALSSGQWDGNLHICNSCGVIVDGANMCVVGFGIPPYLLKIPTIAA
jgi:hypothetical protein